ncbi:MAG: endolytic transglycosylase MltG [Deltaproteobacteria bacterium]|nr:endolytic transglycosylase MltG [Deltaproteobacteria bacterium]
MKKLRTIISVILFLVFSSFICFLLDLSQYVKKPAAASSVKKVVIIQPGQGLNATIEQLSKKGIINHRFKFKLFARLKGYDKSIQSGEYLLSPSMPPSIILEFLVNGKVNLHKITVVEGYNLNQIADIVAKAGFSSRTDFYTAATDTSFVHEKGIDAETFEGYLFPETYYFPKVITPEKMISTMVDRFRSVFAAKWKKRAKDLGLSIHQIVTLASIIEKETGAPFERPIISSVFHNRLKKGMRLEADPTVIYGLKNFNGNLTRKHLTTWSPYNTYKIKGLPIGPIACPGAKAIEAALYPADTRFIFFVSKRDTTHQFSTNLKDHNKAINKYQLRR